MATEEETITTAISVIVTTMVHHIAVALREVAALTIGTIDVDEHHVVLPIQTLLHEIHLEDASTVIAATVHVVLLAIARVLVFHDDFVHAVVIMEVAVMHSVAQNLAVVMFLLDGVRLTLVTFVNGV
uniref:Uncharacterized protein n=1 Tax=Lygus hesperus TaxID=30085 RepID=A0A0A9XAG8_LYGHE